MYIFVCFADILILLYGTIILIGCLFNGRLEAALNITWRVMRCVSKVLCKNIGNDYILLHEEDTCVFPLHKGKGQWMPPSDIVL